MKKIILIVLILLFGNHYSLLTAQPGWIVQTIGNQYDGFNTLNFFNLNTGMVVSGYSGSPSYYGRIYRTTNSGNNRILTFNDSSHGYNKFTFINNTLIPKTY